MFAAFGKHQILVFCLGATALSSGCKKSDDHAGPMPQPSKAPPADFPVDTGKRIDIARDGGLASGASAASSGGRPTFDGKQLKELKRSLPTVKGTTTVDPLEPAPHSRLARMTLCTDASVAEATAALVTAYKRKNWGEMTVSTPSNNDNHRSFSANSDRFRLNGTTTQGEFEHCKKSLKQTRISLNFQERQPPTRAELEAKGSAEDDQKGQRKDAQAKPSTLKDSQLKRVLPSLRPNEAVHLAPAEPKKSKTKSELR